jgi:hypothetical protein
MPKSAGIGPFKSFKPFNRFTPFKTFWAGRFQRFQMFQWFQAFNLWSEAYAGQFTDKNEVLGSENTVLWDESAENAET